MALVNVGIGVSKESDLVKSAAEAAKESKKEVGGKKPKLLMLFCTHNYPKEQYKKAQEAVYKVFGDDSIPLIGGTTLGFFAKNKYYFDPGLFGETIGRLSEAVGKVFKPLKFSGSAVLALESDFIQIGVGIGEKAFDNPRLAGRQAIERALENLDYNPQVAYLAALKKGARDITRIRPVNGFLLTPGNCEEGKFYDSGIIEGIISVAKDSLKIQGGGLCGGTNKKSTIGGTSFYNGNIYEKTVIVVIFGSELTIGFGVGSGSEPIDNIGLVTELGDDEWTIKKINGKPAADVICEAIKKNTPVSEKDFYEVPALLGLEGYALVSPDTRGSLFWSNFPTKVLEDKSVVLMLPVKKGMMFALGKDTKESCGKATVDATKLMMEDVNTNNFGFVMFFSCAVRGMIMGRNYFKEIEEIKKTLDKKDVPIFGICSNGEQAFYKTGSPVGTAFTITMMGISNHFISEKRDENN
jgi:hypothetical protein